MAPLVLCTCRSHCSKYDPEKKAYTGSQLVNRATQFEHRKDDNRSKGLDGFATNVASTILDESSHLGLSRGIDDLSTLSPLSTEIRSQELLTIEGEIRGRITWTPADWTLVFVTNALDQDFQDPLAIPDYSPNKGPHTLDPSHQRNLAFIENENRLFEIIVNLNALTLHPEQRDELTEMAAAGLQEMMHHKRREWDRQRKAAAAISDGLVVVHTGLMTQLPVESSR